MQQGLTLALTLSLAAGGMTQSPIAARKPVSSLQDRQAQSFQRMVLPGKKVAPAVRKLTRLTWHKKLRSAKRAAIKSNKPILWLQVLGKLRGLT